MEEIVKMISLLNAGHFVKTQILSSQAWHVNLILKAENNEIYIPIIEEYICENVLINDFIRCRFYHGDKEYTLMCHIKEMFLTLPMYLRATVKKADIYKNTRAAERYDVSYICKVTNTSDGSVIVANVVNLSSLGCAFISNEQISANTKLRLEIFALGTSYVQVFADVVRFKQRPDGKIEYGSKFTNITEEEKTKIDFLIKQIKLKEEEIYKILCKEHRIKPLNDSLQLGQN